jgi:hypothetical protein
VSRIHTSNRLARRVALVTAALAALTVVAVPSAVLASGPRARATRTFSLKDTGNLHLTSKHNFTLNERGSTSGTVTGVIYVHLTIASSSSVTAEVSMYPHGGSITGYARAGYHRGSTTASFSGTISIQRGTGAYANARGSGLGFSGTIAKSNDAITVHLSGTVSD